MNQAETLFLDKLEKFNSAAKKGEAIEWKIEELSWKIETLEGRIEMLKKRKRKLKINLLNRQLIEAAKNQNDRTRPSDP